MGEERFLKKPIKVLVDLEHYIVFDKPSGLLVIATPRKEENTLVNIVNYQYKKSNEQIRLYPCHRLDRDTSGVIIFAKDKRHQQLMMEAFQKKEVKKKYIAFVHGRMQPNEGEFRKSIRHFEQNKFKRHSPSKEAVTGFRVNKHGKDFSVVEVFPLTGRTNQIRIHFSQAGHPLVGERKYAIASKYPIKFKRVALHSAEISWTDSKSRKTINIKSELPNDMEVFLARNTN